jgi:hypothetical protein
MRISLLPCVLVLAAVVWPTAVAGQAACAELLEPAMPRVVISSAEESPPDPARDWPARCVVSGAIDSRIRFVLHLPASDAWNGKYLMGGGGGFGGVVSNQALAPGLPGGDALQRGYATIGTDTGHRGTGLDASWAVDNWHGIVDYGYRAVHETALLGKALTAMYYGQAPRHSYFFGCSNGGRQGMMEAQRYPHTFDGIVAGAPGYDFPNKVIHFRGIAEAMFPGGDPTQPVLSEARVQELSEAVLAVCDAADGLADGIISDPAGCTFDPRTDLHGWSEEEIRAVEAVYGSLTVGRRTIHPGYPPGHEAAAGGWPDRISGRGTGFPTNYLATVQVLGAMVLNDPTFRLADAPSTEELFGRSPMLSRVLNATSPDLRTFQEAGGRLLVFHGWADHAVSAYTSTDYHRDVVEKLGGSDNVDDFFRLFLLPGVLHCSGGEGPDRVDWIGALERWVEAGEAPDRLVALRLAEDEELVMSRPLCPYPRRAVYDGVGDPKREASFSCQRWGGSIMSDDSLDRSKPEGCWRGRGQ